MPTVVGCITEWRGTCSLKHLAVVDLLKGLGIEADIWLAAYQIDPASVTWNEEVRTALSISPVYDVHNYVTLKSTGEIVDVTFPRHFSKFGLKTSDSARSFSTLACSSPIKTDIVHPNSNLRLMKDRWLGYFNDPPALSVREAFVQSLAQLTVLDHFVTDRRQTIQAAVSQQGL
ncbi:MAG: hypothetical protein H0X13_08890 [Ramlibacter sp.]|nr:hypothetical protein [Ramlibacter sp.]